MRVIRREWFNVSRSDQFTVTPIGDVHTGAAACDEALLKRIVKRIAKDPDAYWVGLGDYAEFINTKDKRFDFGTLAEWVDVVDLLDLAHAQVERFLSLIRPIASKCLGLARGNHEDTIQRHFERDVYSEIVTRIKRDGGFDADHKLALGFYGWLLLAFFRSSEKHRVRSTVIRLNVHHGFVGGRLAGAKALNMQRWLWNHECDIAVFGHSHNTAVQVESVERISQSGKVVNDRRYGCFAGTFLRSINEDGPSTYSERRGYFPLPIGGCEMRLRPGAKRHNDMIRIMI